MELWDQKNDFFRIFRSALDEHEGASCPCTQMSGTDTIDSDRVALDEDFQVVLRYVFPASEVDKVFVKPVIGGPLLQLARSCSGKNLFNTLFVSRGETRGILHAHNYDVFGAYPAAGAGSRMILFPVELYPRFRSRCMPAKSGVINFHNYELEDELMDQAVVIELEAGDIVHIPFCWYHRVDHQGEYVHMATNWFFPELLEDRLAAVRDSIPRDEWALFEAHTRRFRVWNVLAPLDHLVDLVAERVPALQRLMPGFERAKSRLLDAAR